MTEPLDAVPMEDPEAPLEKAFIDEYVRMRGFEPTALERRLAYEGTTDSLQLFLHEVGREDVVFAQLLPRPLGVLGVDNAAIATFDGD